MKTAISIPDSLYQDAEQLAARLGKSRSQLYAQAVRLYLSAHRKDGVTRKLDEVYTQTSSKLDPALEHLQRLSLPKEGW